MRATRTPRQTERTVRLLRSADNDGTAVIRVTVNGDATCYAVREIRCDIGGRGFEVHKLGIGTLYHVRVGEADDQSCECLGYLRHGYCRHISGLLALVQAGKV